STSPAWRSSLRWRETAGRLIGRTSAICWTERAPPPRTSRIARRLGSPSASNGSPARLRAGWVGLVRPEHKCYRSAGAWRKGIADTKALEAGDGKGDGHEGRSVEPQDAAADVGLPDVQGRFGRPAGHRVRRRQHEARLPVASGR